MKPIIPLVLFLTITASAGAQNCASRGGARNNTRVPGVNMPPAGPRLPTTPYAFGYGNPLRPPLGQPLNPFVPTLTQPFVQPLWYPQTPLNPLLRQATNPDPLAGSYSSYNPLEKQAAAPDSSLQRSSDEKDTYVRNAIRRGYQAEQNGNLILARACYENACNVYPDVPLTSEAKAALDRLKGR